MPKSAASEEIAEENATAYLQELPLEDEERLEKLFNRIDQNGNGIIDIHDLSHALREYGYQVHHGYAKVSLLIY